MHTRTRQSGEGRLGCILWTILVVVAAMIAIKVVPVKIAMTELKDHMENLAERHPRGTNEEFRRSIYQRAKELDLPVEQKEITVVKSDRKANMKVEFTYPLDFIVYTYQWKIKIVVDRDIYLI